MSDKKLVIIRIKGEVRTPGDIEDTLIMLKLRKKNACVIVADTPSTRGMIRKADGHITWGEINEETLKLLQEKKGPVFHLHPPRKGFGRKGIKMPFSKGGATGYRADKINDLLGRML